MSCGDSLAIRSTNDEINTFSERDLSVQLPIKFELVVPRLPQPCEWASFGAGRHSFTMLAQAFILGGHCRIGMEDTVHLARGKPSPSNAALVE
jgi:uncharacterized protein (DUF849 family)